MTTIELFDNLMKAFNPADGADTIVGDVGMTTGEYGGIIDCPDCSGLRNGVNVRVAIFDQSIVVGGVYNFSHQQVHGILLNGHTTISVDVQEKLKALSWKGR